MRLKFLLPVSLNPLLKGKFIVTAHMIEDLLEFIIVKQHRVIQPDTLTSLLSLRFLFFP